VQDPALLGKSTTIISRLDDTLGNEPGVCGPFGAGEKWQLEGFVVLVL